METLGICTVICFSFKYQNTQPSFQVWRHSLNRSTDFKALILNVSKGWIKDIFAAVVKHKTTQEKGMNTKKTLNKTNKWLWYNCENSLKTVKILTGKVGQGKVNLFRLYILYKPPFEILEAVLQKQDPILPWLTNEAFFLHMNKVAPFANLIKAPWACGFCELL